jgi:hypothetical protein
MTDAGASTSARSRCAGRGPRGGWLEWARRRNEHSVLSICCCEPSVEAAGDVYDHVTKRSPLCERAAALAADAASLRAGEPTNVHLVCLTAGWGADERAPRLPRCVAPQTTQTPPSSPPPEHRPSRACPDPQGDVTAGACTTKACHCRPSCRGATLPFPLVLPRRLPSTLGPHCRAPHRHRGVNRARRGSPTPGPCGKQLHPRAAERLGERYPAPRRCPWPEQSETPRNARRHT